MEAAVAGGIPILTVLREGIAGDRIEIRGRDSAGLAIQVVFADSTWYAGLSKLLEDRGLRDEFEARIAED